MTPGVVPGSAPGRDAEAGLAQCRSGALFDHLPLAPDEFRALRPLGWISPPIHVIPARFSSFSRSLPGETRPPTPVEFPGDATVTGVLIADFPATGAHGYQVQFSPCRDTRFQFNHIGALSPVLQTAVDAAPKVNCREFNPGGENNLTRTCQANLSLQVHSGDLLGMSDEFAGVDFVAIDYRGPKAAFTNPADYQGDFFYYVSPVPYFTPATRAVLESRLGSYDGTVPRTADPIIGTYMQDLPGTAQGNWFLPGGSPATTDSSDGALALVHDYVAPTEPVISVGTGVGGLASGVYSFTPQPSGTVNRDFSAVTADATTYCYDQFHAGRTTGGIALRNDNGALLVRMPDSDHLDVEFRPGVDCAGVGADPAMTNASHYAR
ncbi:MAG: hypothetical protein WD271_12585 [Acidimicrobiia bacterium]